MSKQQIRLVSLGVESFAGLNKESKAEVVYPVDISEKLKKVDSEHGIVLVFPDGFRYQQSEGDQGTGKTSLQQTILSLLGNFLPPNAINSIDGTIKANMRVWGLDGHFYHIRSTKKDFVIERIETDEEGNPLLNEKGKEIKAEMKSPKTLIKQLVGTAGISPQWLRDMKPDEQVKWLRDQYRLSGEVLKTEIEIRQDYEKNYKARTAAGNEHKRYKALVNASPYIQDYAKHEAFFKSNPYEKIEEEMQSVQEKYNDYNRVESHLDQLNNIALKNAEANIAAAENDIRSLEEQIKELQRRLSLAHDRKQETVTTKNNVLERIAESEKWISDNQQVKADYDNLSTKVIEATNFKANKQSFEQLVENKKQMDHYSNEYIRLQSRLDEIAKLKKEFISSFSPEIEGFEVCIPDEEDKREGLFYHGKPLHELAESELWEMATALWESLNVQMVFVENISSLGTGAVAMFNKFIEQGGYVFATLMNRAEKNLKITFDTKIA